MVRLLRLVWLSLKCNITGMTILNSINPSEHSLLQLLLRRSHHEWYSFVMLVVDVNIRGASFVHSNMVYKPTELHEWMCHHCYNYYCIGYHYYCVVVVVASSRCFMKWQLTWLLRKLGVECTVSKLTVSTVECWGNADMRRRGKWR
jgi:hypothetical protein